MLTRVNNMEDIVSKQTLTVKISSGEKDLVMFDSFEGMHLKEELLRGILAYGLKKPSAIQQRAIMPCVEGRDVHAQAHAGTGKTCTYIISMLQRIDTSVPDCQALILVPTRELAQQIRKMVVALGDPMNVTCHACTGGTNMEEEIREFETGFHVVVGTNGRVYDMIKRNSLRTSSIKMLVLDDVDEMLSRQFKDQIEAIFDTLPKGAVQVISFSSFIPKKIKGKKDKQCDWLMRNPINIILEALEVPLMENVKQFIVNVESEEKKVEALLALYNTLSITQAVIFCRWRRDVDSITQSLRDSGFTVSAMHGGLKQSDRDEGMREFRAGSSRALITTDFLIRGIDAQLLSLVINYDLPIRETYVKRIWQGGVFNRKRVSINLVTPMDLINVAEIEKVYDATMEELPKNVSDVISLLPDSFKSVLCLS